MTATIEETVRTEGGRVLATLIRLTGDFDLAEDAVSEAVVVALEKWPVAGVPSKPGAWLTTVARNKALDRVRREARRKHREIEAAALWTGETDQEDDMLRLMFTCCHPALSKEAQVALTLRTVSGLSTGEIARAFLVPEPTIGQRISRAKRKITEAHIPYRVPEAHELPDRVPSVLSTVYLMFTTGHHAPRGRLESRVELATEAIRLGRILRSLMPDEAEVAGLLALMLAVEARRDTRVDEQGDLVLLADQDRSRWDHEAVAEASRLVESTLRRGRAGPYQIEASIACLHGVAPSDAATDWPQIVDLYRMLERIIPTPVVKVNRAVAESKVFGPAAGLDILDRVEGMERWHLYWSARAELLRQQGRDAEAAEAYGAALECDMNDTDRSFLIRRLSEVKSTASRDRTAIADRG